MNRTFHRRIVHLQDLKLQLFQYWQEHRTSMLLHLLCNLICLMNAFLLKVLQPSGKYLNNNFHFKSFSF